MKTFIFSIFLGLASTAMAQITVQVNDFATANDTVRMSLANPLNIDLQNTGPNSTWDFSQLSAQSQTLINYNPIGFGSILIIATYGPIASTPYKATYFNLTNDLPIDQFSAFLPIELSNLSQYTRRTNSQINSIGYSIDVQGQGVPFKSDTIETRYELPLNFNDTYTSRGYTYIDLNPATDIKFIQHRQRNSVVDGWGSITTPLGTFNALRIRHDITENQRVLDTVKTLNDSGPRSIGKLLYASHESMRDDFEISVDELDAAVETALRHGAIGARMTGGGFGGAAIALTPIEKIGEITLSVLAEFENLGFTRPDIFTVSAAPGARRES